jgi:hypothetical protein
MAASYRTAYGISCRCCRCVCYRPKVICSAPLERYSFAITTLSFQEHEISQLILALLPGISFLYLMCKHMSLGSGRTYALTGMLGVCWSNGHCARFRSIGSPAVPPSFPGHVWPRCQAYPRYTSAPMRLFQSPDRSFPPAPGAARPFGLPTLTVGTQLSLTCHLQFPRSARTSTARR